MEENTKTLEAGMRSSQEKLTFKQRFTRRFSAKRIALMAVFKHIGRKGFPGQNIATISFITQNVVDGAFTPFGATCFRFTTNICQKIGDILG